MLKLILRDPKFVDGYKEYCQESYDNNITTFIPTNPKNIDENWFERTALLYAQKEKGNHQGHPRSIHYWAIDDDKFIGEFQLRPDLDVDLMNGIGSIGYSVRVSEWGKGYGQEILKQGLIMAADYGLDKVIFIINDDNIVSSKVCEKNGGVLMDKIKLESEDEGERLVRRYWIYL